VQPLLARLPVNEAHYFLAPCPHASRATPLSRRDGNGRVGEAGTQKFGLNEETAKQVVTTVADFLKAKLPAPVAGQIDRLLAGGTADLGSLAKGLGGLLGGKK